MRNTAFITAGFCGLALTCTANAETITADVWADNWFSLSVNEAQVAEDSVSITTERSFNSESFSFSAQKPYALNFIVKDFKQDDTGLEYIGTNRQQMGDGGFIAQFKDSTNNIVAVTNSDWKCLVTHTAPIDKSCENESDPQAGSGACGFIETAEPDNWQSVSFDDSSWDTAIEYSETAVGPKMGYDKITWDSSAHLIWGPDLETNNTLLCRTVIK